MPPRRRAQPRTTYSSRGSPFEIPAPDPEDLAGSDELRGEVYRLLQEQSLEATRALIDLALGVRIGVPVDVGEEDEVMDGELFHGHRVYSNPPDFKALSYWFDKLHGKPSPLKEELRTRKESFEDMLTVMRRELTQDKIDGKMYQLGAEIIEGEMRELPAGGVGESPTKGTTDDVWELAAERLK